MKKIATVALVTALVALPLSAETAHQHGQAEGKSVGGMMMGMMSHDDMMKMQEHMADMQETMSQIHAETDPDKRKALMREHRKTMHEAMDRMMAKPEAMSGMNMDERMRMMEERMRMTRMMMWQMMERDAESETEAD